MVTGTERDPGALPLLGPNPHPPLNPLIGLSDTRDLKQHSGAGRGSDVSWVVFVVDSSTEEEPCGPDERISVPSCPFTEFGEASLPVGADGWVPGAGGDGVEAGDERPISAGVHSRAAARRAMRAW